METDTFPRRDVQEFLGHAICLKFDVSQDDRVANKFGVKGFPTFILLHPNGTVLYNGAGKPPGPQFVSMFTYEYHNELVKSFNARKVEDAARRIFFLRRWFKGSKAAKAAAGMYEDLKNDEKFVAAYKRAEAETKAELKKLQDRARAEARAAEQRRELERLKAEADTIYATRGKRYHSYRIYKKIILEFPKSPEAADARKRLRKHGQRWKEPEAEKK